MAIDTEILCITHGKLAWLLDIQITVMNYAGNLIDPILYALLYIYIYILRVT